jgi:hypothetical protein
MRDRAVSRPPLIAWVTLGDGCRVRRVRGACLRLVAWGCDGRGAGRGPVAAAPERIGGARDRLEQSVRTWGGRLAATTGAAPGAVRITLPGGRDSPGAGDTAAPSCGAPRPALGLRHLAVRASGAPGESAMAEGPRHGSPRTPRGTRPAQSSRSPGRLRSHGVPVSGRRGGINQHSARRSYTAAPRAPPPAARRVGVTGQRQSAPAGRPATAPG